MERKDYNRIWAFLIDVIIFSLFASIVSSLMFSYDEQTLLLGLTVSKWMVCYNLCVLLYFFVFDAAFEGVTIGKSIFSLKVYTQEDAVPHLGKRILRSFIKWISTWVFPVSVLVFIFSRKTLHDAVCNTQIK